MSKENPIVEMKTNKGVIKIELFEDDAPETVENFIKYVKDGFFDGLLFHRVIDGFVIQGGGFEPGMKERDTTYPSIKNEAGKSGHSNERGTVAMARTSDPHSATSQFYINLKDNTSLDHDEFSDGYGYCVFGEIVDGMDVVDKIGSVKTKRAKGHADVPVNDVIIEKAQLL